MKVVCDCCVSFIPSTISRSNSFMNHDQLFISGRGRSRVRLSVNMGLYCATEESNVSNCPLFIDDFVSLLTCVNERVGVKVCYSVYIYVCVELFHREDNCIHVCLGNIHEMCIKVHIQHKMTYVLTFYCK